MGKCLRGEGEGEGVGVWKCLREEGEGEGEREEDGGVDGWVGGRMNGCVGLCLLTG